MIPIVYLLTRDSQETMQHDLNVMQKTEASAKYVMQFDHDFNINVSDNVVGSRLLIYQHQ